MLVATTLVAAAAAALLSSTVAAQNATIPATVLPEKVISVIDEKNFCLLLPAVPDISIGQSEGSAISKCFGTAGTPGVAKLEYPNDIILSAHVIKTPNHFQVTGKINLVGLRVSPEGGGGQYDDAGWGIEPKSHCAGYDRYVEIVGGDTYCLRCCKLPPGVDFETADHDKAFPCFAGYDIHGCVTVVPGEYGPGFDFKEQADLPLNSTNPWYEFPASAFTIPGQPLTTTEAATTAPAETTTAAPVSTVTSATVLPAGPATTTSAKSGAVRIAGWGAAAFAVFVAMLA